MSDGNFLLRMLEPALRPGGAPAAPKGASAPAQPIESRPFESLLEEARQMGGQAGVELGGGGRARPADAAGDAGTGAASGAAAARSPLGPLAQLDRVENPGLRRIIGGDVEPA